MFWCIKKIVSRYNIHVKQEAAWAGVLKTSSFFSFNEDLMKQKKRNKQVVGVAELSKYKSLVRPVIEKIVSNLGFHLVEVSFIKENQENYLRLTVMHEDRPVSTLDCEIISRNVGKELDSSDPIPFAYMFEVQSRGTVAASLENLEHEFVLEKTGLTVRS